MGRNITISGLVAENTGIITNSCTYMKNRRHDDKEELLIKNEGKINRSLMIHNGSVVDMYNAVGNRVIESINKTTDAKKYGFNMDTDWKYVGGPNCLCFKAEKWFTTTNNKQRKRVIHIKNVQDYIDFANGVNSHDVSYLDAYVCLDCDIDCKGKVIPMVADSRNNAFLGVFDGNGHQLWNAVIRDKKSTHNALFGYLKGTIVNLIFDGRVYGSANIAGLCGVNMGEISCCGAVVRLYVKGERTSVSGLVHTNEGTISKCYAVIKHKYPIMPIIPIVAASLIVIALGLLGVKTIQTALDADRVYAAIETEPNQEKLPEDSDDKSEDTDSSNTHKLSFTLNERVVISLVSRECEFVFENPSKSQNKVIVQLRVKNASGEQITVATSKGVDPGYRLRKLKLGDAAGDVLTGTEKDGYIVIIPYDVKTADRAAIETVIPVKISFKD